MRLSLVSLLIWNKSNVKAGWGNIRRRDLRNSLSQGLAPLAWFSYPDVLMSYAGLPSANKQGITLFFYRVVWSGKSTLAKIIYGKFMRRQRPVSLLDGDMYASTFPVSCVFQNRTADLMCAVSGLWQVKIAPRMAG